MQAIKSRILQIWQTAVTPVRICCIKFAQRVVLAQTNVGSEARVRLAVSVSSGRIRLG